MLRRILVDSPRLATVLLLALSALSCDDTPTRPHGVGKAIDSKILVTPSERLSGSGRALVLNCQTERIYGCVNYNIDFTVERQGSTILVDFRDVNLSGSICFTATGPAMCAIDLGDLSQGKYSILFRAGTGHTKVDFFVDEKAYTVIPDEGASVVFPLTRLLRIPDGTIWGLIGYMGYTWGPSDSLADSYIDSLQAHGAGLVTLDPGEYGAFKIDSTGAMQWPGIHGYRFARPYALHYEGPSEPLGEVVEYFGETHAQWLSIQLHTWRGELYRSWLAGSAP